MTAKISSAGQWMSVSWWISIIRDDATAGKPNVVQGSPQGRRSNAGDAAPALEQHHVAPAVAVPADALPAADLAEAAGAVQSQAGVVLGEDPGLQRPDARRLGLRDQPLEQGSADPPAAGTGGYVQADVGHAPVHGARRYRGQGRPPEDPTALTGHQPAFAEVRAVPGRPVGGGRLEGAVSAGDALLVDLADRGPVLGPHAGHLDALGGHAGFDAFSEKNSGRRPSSSGGSRNVPSSASASPGEGQSRKGNSCRNSTCRPARTSDVTTSPREWFHQYSFFERISAARSAYDPRTSEAIGSACDQYGYRSCGLKKSTSPSSSNTCRKGWTSVTKKKPPGFTKCAATRAHRSTSGSHPSTPRDV